MKNIPKLLSAASVAVAVTIASITSAFAVPFPTAKPQQVSTVEEVQFRRDRDSRDQDRREYRRDGYYNGQRGYRDRRAGYRRHSDGFWYPLAAFGAAAITGGAIASQPRASSGGSHAQWCANRYRSYRTYDNTYSPRAGVRATCNSPYS
jgi:hypothetical protein|nr:BA14K family protein [Neorhizobium tomejilense]